MDSGGFNPRTPCGVRRSFHGGQGAAAGFNPRTPCGVRHRFKPGRVIKCRFQSTHSLRSATAAHHRQTAQKTGFNPRTPCGVRHRKHPTGTSTKAFQSTHSLRSATKIRRSTKTFNHVSIHALLAECDPGEWEELEEIYCFNPRTPCGVRHADIKIRAYIDSFNPRTPCGVRQTTKSRHGHSTSFNPRTPCGVRLRPTLYIATQQSKSYFAPTSLKRPSLHGCSF